MTPSESVTRDQSAENEMFTERGFVLFIKWRFEDTSDEDDQMMIVPIDDTVMYS